MLPFCLSCSVVTLVLLLLTVLLVELLPPVLDRDQRTAPPWAVRSPGTRQRKRRRLQRMIGRRS